MGMLIRRHRKGVDKARQVETPPTLETPPIVEGDTGVPDTTSTVVPTGEVPAQPIEPETATGDADGNSKSENPETSSEVQETPAEPAPEVDAPTRNASNKAWREFYTSTGRDIPEDATRDSLAEGVLGPKG